MYIIAVALSCVCIASSMVQPGTQDVSSLTATEDGRATDLVDSQYSSTDTLESQFSEEFLSCGKIPIEETHYQLLENGSVHVPFYRTTFDSRNHYIGNGTLYVCPPPFSNQPDTNDQLILQGILSVVFLMLSCICLGLHLLIFLIVPEYKTLIGKNTASLAVCLFVAYFLFLLPGYPVSTSHCSGIAAAICYFFLASFFWMNSIAFEVWISLNAPIKILQEFIIRTKESTRHLIYSLYSFGVPLVIVGVAVMIDRGLFGPGEFVPVFSEVRCWFESYKPFMVFFIAPFLALTLLNLLLFVSSVIAVTKLKASNGKHEFSPKKRLLLSLRLSAATGLPWIAGIFAMFINWGPLWILFIVCAALQGVYIFVAYNCNKKTLKYLVRTFKGRRQESPTTSVVKNASTHV